MTAERVPVRAAAMGDAGTHVVEQAGEGVLTKIHASTTRQVYVFESEGIGNWQSDSCDAAIELFHTVNTTISTE